MEPPLHLLNHFLFVALLLNHIYTIIHSQQNHRLWTDQCVIKMVFIWKRNHQWALSVDSTWAASSMSPGARERQLAPLGAETTQTKRRVESHWAQLQPLPKAHIPSDERRVSPQWRLSVQEEFPNRWLPFQLNSICFISEPICQEKLWLVGFRFVLIKINFQCGGNTFK